jgi:hypothetical protein
MAAAACLTDRSHASDARTRYGVAWSAIAYHLCTADEAPTRQDLIRTGWQAIYREVREMRHMYGQADRDGTNPVASAPRYRTYWQPTSAEPEHGLVERIAVHQIVDTLAPLYRDAIVALAAHDDYQVAAESLGVSYVAFVRRVNVARKSLRALWYAPETPPPARGTDRRVGSRTTPDHCPAGHDMTGENAIRRPSSRTRRCRACERARDAAKYAARRAGS